MIDIQVDTSRLESAIKQFAEESRKDLSVVARQQAGILVGHVIALTPPGDGKGGALTDAGGISAAARKQGEARVVADITKLFPTTAIPSEERVVAMVEAGYLWKTKGGGKVKAHDFARTMGDIERIHRFARGPRGRVRTGRGANVAVTRKGLLREYIKKQKARVGLLNAGWLRAARELKTSARNVPAWIRRHGPRPGGTDIRDRGYQVAIAIFNEQRYFPSDMESRVRRAVARRQSGLEKALEAMLARKAARAQKRMG